MATKLRAVIISPDKNNLAVLLDFLFRIGLRETVVSLDFRQAAYVALQGFWPIVLIDHQPPEFNALDVFENMFKQNGYEFFPYALLIPSEQKEIITRAPSIGVTGVIKKPLQPTEAKSVLQDLILASASDSTELAMETALQLMDKDFALAMKNLPKLLASKNYSKTASIAMIRSEQILGYNMQAQEKITKLYSENPKEIRILCEIGDFFFRNNQYSEAIKYYAKIREYYPEIKLKYWEQISILSELDQFDDVAKLLSRLLEEDPSNSDAAEGLARLMILFGLENHLTKFLRIHPKASKNLSAYKTAKT